MIDWFIHSRHGYWLPLHVRHQADYWEYCHEQSRECFHDLFGRKKETNDWVVILQCNTVWWRMYRLLGSCNFGGHNLDLDVYRKHLSHKPFWKSIERCWLDLLSIKIYLYLKFYNNFWVNHSFWSLLWFPSMDKMIFSFPFTSEIVNILVFWMSEWNVFLFFTFFFFLYFLWDRTHVVGWERDRGREAEQEPEAGFYTRTLGSCMI